MASSARRRRAECAGERRRARFVACGHHLFSTCPPTGAIRLNFPDLEVWEMTGPARSTLRTVAATLDEVGAIMEPDPQRIRQVG